MKSQEREVLDQTLCAMFSNTEYNANYLFYAHLVGMCSIKIAKELPAPAGVRFWNDHYEMFINPYSVWAPISAFKADPKKIEEQLEEHDIRTDENGEKIIRVSKGFNDFTLVERLAILKHEMLHILYDHVGSRKEGLEPYPWNLAADCALNQHIDINHLPKSAVLPERLEKVFKAKGKKFPPNETAEFYYNLLVEIAEQQKKDGGPGDGEPDLNGDPMGNPTGGPGGNDGMDSHGSWDDSKGDPELQKDITKKMLDNAQNETLKSKGTLPSQMDKWMEMFTRKAEVNWRKVLRGIVGNKRVGKRSTIMRNDRRFPKRDDLRGHVKERVFNLLVVADVSGSMSDKAVLATLGEVRHICDITKTAVDLIQIDTEAYKPEKLSKKTKLIQRKGQGGTILHSALDRAKEFNIDYQAIVVLTDGYLFGDDITCFGDTRKKVIWLIEPEGQITDDMKVGLMKAFKMSGINKVSD